MAIPADDYSTPGSHGDIELLLPWYANGTLDPTEMAAVEQHLAQCATCRAQLAQCHRLAAIVQNRAQPVWQPAPGDFDRLMAQIDQLESKPEPITARARPLLQRMREGLAATPNPVRWLLALEGVAVALLLVIALPLSTPADYETLSNSAVRSTATGPCLRVVFADSATVGEVQRLLQDIEGGVVAGPTALGVYTVALPTGGDPEPVRTRALARLRGHDAVRLAEPLACGGAP